MVTSTKINDPNGAISTPAGLSAPSASSGKINVLILSRIPVLGNLFKFTSRTEGKTELVILITPRVISDSAQAVQATDEVKGKLEELKRQFTR